MNNKKILNYRPLVVILITLSLGIFISYLYFNSKIKNTFNFAILIFALIVVTFVVLVTYFFFSKIHNKRKFLNLLLLIVIVLILSTIVSFVSFKVFLNFSEISNKNVVVAGKIEKVNANNYFELGDSEITYNNKLYKINVPIVVENKSNLENLLVGNKIEFSGVLKYSHNNTLNYSLHDVILNGEFNIVLENDSLIKNNVPRVNFKYQLKQHVKNLLMNIMSEDNASIANGVLFGEKSGLDSKVTDMFSYAGISHILAVSGLHIGILVTLLVFLLKKIKANKYVAFILVALFLFSYAYLCDFSPSVLRASLMFLIYYGSSILGQRNDKLNSWCLAGIILLFFNPLNLFNVGFQLSFVCIFALFLLSNYVVKLLIKLKFGKLFSAMLAPSIAINLLTLPIISTIFNRFSLLGIFLICLFCLYFH